MHRTQLYIPEEYHKLLAYLANIHSNTLSSEVRRAIKTYLEEERVKKIVKKYPIKEKVGKKSNLLFADMIGIFSGPKNASTNVDEIYDED